MENDPDVVDYLFEMQKSGTGLNKLVRREEIPEKIKSIVCGIRIRFLDYIRRVPQGLLGLIGAPGIGKTEMISIIAAVRVIAWSKISCAAPSNAAVNAFYSRLITILGNLDYEQDFIVMRPYSTHIEIDITQRFLLAQHGQTQWDQDPFYNRHDKVHTLENVQWNKSGSITSTILQLQGRIRTSNNALKHLRMKPSVAELIAVIEDKIQTILFGTNSQHGSSQYNDVPQDIRPYSEKSLASLLHLLARQILWKTAAVFTTIHVALDKIIKPYTKSAN